MAKYIREFQSPWIKAWFDVGNVMFYGYPQDWIHTLGNSIAEVHPGVAVLLALEVFDVNLDDAVSQGVNPVLWIAVEHDVAHIEPRFNPWTLKFANILRHLERTQEEFVPHFFDGDDNF